MVASINFAHTSKINPSGATPILTRAQVWIGLQRKIRFPQEFVPVIESCEVLKDDSGVVERLVKFKKGQAPKDEAREVVRGWEDCWVDFELDDGTHIRNVISEGPSGNDDDLNLTYMYEFRFPKLEPNSEELEKEKAKFKAMSKQSVESSIDVIREMVKDGRIKA